MSKVAAGRWHSILPALGVPADHLRDRHGPCPGCGGRDRFRFDDRDGRGSFVCGQGGGEPLAGDGFDLLGHVLGWDFPQALQAVAKELGLDTAVESPSPEELERCRQEQEERRREEQARRQRKAEEAAAKAAEMWQNARAATPGNPYLSRKGVQPVVTLRELEVEAVTEILGYTPQANGKPLEGLLLVAPVKVTDELTTVELIDGEGRKSAVAGGLKAAGWWATGLLKKAHNILVGEGVATVLSAAEATGYPAVAGLASNNLPRVAEALRSQYPEVTLIILADLNKSTEEPDPGAAEAARRAGGLLAVPDFGGERPEGAKDFNDLHQARGPKAVAEALAGAPYSMPRAAMPGDPEKMFTPPPDLRPEQGGGGAPSAAEIRPTIYLEGGTLHHQVDAAEDALLRSSAPIFRRGTLLVRVVASPGNARVGRQRGAPILQPVEADHLREVFNRVARWQRFDIRRQDYVDKNCPQEVARTYLARAGEWRVPYLAGIVEAPTLRPDGSILQEPGYDPAIALLFDPGGGRFPTIPELPTREAAQAALSTLREPLAAFPFVSRADEAVALSGILTALVRRSLPAAPMHGFSAPSAGTGKSLLVDLAAMIATGRPAAVAAQGFQEEESEKRLGAALLEGDAVLTLDNAERPIRGELLCQILTQETVSVRILGQSKTAKLPTNAALFATGNNLLFAGDMTRRALLGMLDAGMERPEERRFERDLYDEVPRRRGELVAAALTLLRAYHAAGLPGQDLRPLGGFETWSRWVRGALVWAGVADPATTVERIREADPQQELLGLFLAAWYEAFRSEPHTVKDAIHRARQETHDDLAEALGAISGQGDRINTRAVGRWLHRNQNRPVNGWVLRQMGQDPKSKVARWQVIQQDLEVGTGFSGFSGSDSDAHGKLADDSYIKGGAQNPRNPENPAGEVEP